MKTSDNGLAIVKAFEGCHKAVRGKPGYFKAYKDPVGVLTIGWGHTNHHQPHFTEDTVWSQRECDDALRADLATFERHVSQQCKIDLVQHEFDALVSWAYNTGGSSSSSVWRSLNAGDKSVIPAKLAMWNKAKGRVLAGLTRRRKAEGLLFEGKFTEAFKVAGTTAPTSLPRTPAPASSKTAETTTAGGVVAGTVAAATQATSWEQIAIIIAIGAAVAVAAWFVITRIKKGK